MKIDRLNQGTILVSMAAQDLRDYKLDFSKETEPNAVHSGLKRLLHHVGERCSITPGGRSFLIEALPSKEGCLLLRDNVSKLVQEGRTSIGELVRVTYAV